MNVRCFYCGWNFNLTPAEIATAGAEADASRATTYMVHCPKCRRAIKVPVKQMRRFVPRGGIAQPAPASGSESAPPAEEAAGETGAEESGTP